MLGRTKERKAKKASKPRTSDSSTEWMDIELESPEEQERFETNKNLQRAKKQIVEL
ncbi:hypothetical protein C0992_008882, partial [Termitomyces sp. T32_za158]